MRIILAVGIPALATTAACFSSAPDPSCPATCDGPPVAIVQGPDTVMVQGADSVWVLGADSVIVIGADSAAATAGEDCKQLTLLRRGAAARLLRFRGDTARVVVLRRTVP